MMANSMHLVKNSLKMVDKVFVMMLMWTAKTASGPYCQSVSPGDFYTWDIHVGARTG